MRRLHLLHAVAAATVMLVAGLYTPADAGVARVWTNGHGTFSWYDYLNWLPNTPGAPFVDDDLTVGAGTLATSSGAAVTTDDGGSITVNNGSTVMFGELTVGDDGNGTLDINGGGSVTNTDGRVGYNIGGIGMVTVENPGSFWECTGNLSLGNATASGDGELTISDNGTVYVGDAARSSAVSYRLIVSDYDGTGLTGGHLGVYNGSTLNNGVAPLNIGVAIVGDDAGEFGWATVSGAGSSWINTGYLCVGSDGTGTLTVQDGGSVSNTDGWIGMANTGTVTVADSTWENTGNLQLGNSSFGGVGELIISDGGTVFVGDAARSGGVSGTLTVSDSNGSGSTGGHLYVYNGSTLAHHGGAVLGDDAGEHGWATVSGASSMWMMPGGMNIGYRGNGVLAVDDHGRLETNYVTLGRHAGSSGTATVATEGSWTSVGTFYVGYEGSSVLKVESGGELETDSAILGVLSGVTGTATVSGADSTWTMSGGMNIGYYGNGVLTVDDYGRLETNYITLGRHAGSSGTATVATEGSWTSVGTFYVGYAGTGTLKVESGGELETDSAILGMVSGVTGTATVSGADSTWTMPGGMNIGYRGNGVLTVDDHGRLETNYVTLGRHAGSSGTATVATEGSWTSVGTFYVGYEGTSTLKVESGGELQTDSAILGVWSGVTGMVTVKDSGSIWECTGNLSLGRPTDSGVGELTISNDGTVYVGDGARNVGTEGWLTVSGSQADGSAGGHLAIYNGSALTLTTGGGSMLPRAVVGYAAGEYGWVTVSGVNGVASSLLVDEILVVGNVGTGELNVNQGGKVSAGGCFVGYLGGDGSVIVDGGSGGTVSLLDVDGLLGVGLNGTGELSVTGGGKVSPGWCYIGINDGSQGTVIVNGKSGDGTASFFDTGTLMVGNSGTGEVRVTDGGSVSSNNNWVGYHDTGVGTVEVDGSDSIWECEGILSLGRLGVGTLTISTAGTVHVGDAAGTAITDGRLIVSDSQYNGPNVYGDLSIENGSRLTHGGEAVLGDGAGEYGVAVVDGVHAVTAEPSLLDIGGELYVGNFGTGELYVTDGALADLSGALFVADKSDSTGTVNVTDGARLETALAIRLSRMPGSNAAMIVNDAEVECDARVFVGAVQGTGALTVENGGQLTAVGVDVGRAGVGPVTGTVTVDGGTLDVQGDLLIQPTGQVDFLDGTIQAGLLDGEPGQFNWTGGRLSVGQYIGDLHNQGGTMAPGHSPGLTEVFGDYTQDSTGVLEIQIEGTDPLEYDRLQVTDTLTPGGTLLLTVGAIFEMDIAAGDTFDILDWGSLVGTFDTVNLCPLPGLAWDDSQLYTTGVLTVTPEPSTLCLLGFAALGFLAYARRIRRHG